MITVTLLDLGVPEIASFLFFCLGSTHEGAVGSNGVRGTFLHSRWKGNTLLGHLPLPYWALQVFLQLTLDEAPICGIYNKTCLY